MPHPNEPTSPAWSTIQPYGPLRAFVRRFVIDELSWRRLVRSIIEIYVVLLVAGLLFSDCLMFRPHASSYTDGPNFIKLACDDGTRITATWLPNSKARFVLLFSHGNAEDIGEMRPYFEYLRQQGFGVLGYDYHGYGTSGGSPSEKSAYRDIDAAYDFLTGRAGIAPERIIVYGRSIGGGPSVDLAARKPVGGLVLESAFTTASRVMTRFPIFPFDKFRNISKIGNVGCPVLVIHGRADRVIPFHHGRSLYEAAKKPKRHLWVDGAGHNDLLWVAGDECVKALVDFAKFVGERQDERKDQ